MPCHDFTYQWISHVSNMTQWYQYHHGIPVVLVSNTVIQSWYHESLHFWSKTEAQNLFFKHQKFSTSKPKNHINFTRRTITKTQISCKTLHFFPHRPCHSNPIHSPPHLTTAYHSLPFPLHIPHPHNFTPPYHTFPSQTHPKIFQNLQNLPNFHSSLQFHSIPHLTKMHLFTSTFLLLCFSAISHEAAGKPMVSAKNHPITRYLRQLQDVGPEPHPLPDPVATQFPSVSPTDSPTVSPTYSPTSAPTTSPTGCMYSCPNDAYPKSMKKCPTSFKDCKCMKGFMKVGEDAEVCSSCNTHTCEEFSVQREDKQCVRSQSDCECIRGFRWRAKKCRYCDQKKCPGVYEPRPEIQCVRRFRHCYVPPKND